MRGRHNERATGHLLQRAYGDAVADCTTALRLHSTTNFFSNPELADVYRKRGHACSEIGRFAEALADFDEALRLLAMSWCLHADGRIGLPDSRSIALCQYDRGLVWSRKGETDQAIAAYTEAIRLDPGNDKAYNNRGGCYSKKGEWNNAVADYSEAIRLDPKTAGFAFYNRGRCHAKLGRHAHAIADYGDAIRLDPSDRNFYKSRADAFRALGHESKAFLDERRAREADLSLPFDPASSNFHSERGKNSARRDLEVGEVLHMSSGYVKNTRTCPRCVRITAFPSGLFDPLPPNACTTCGTTLVIHASQGCEVSSEMEPFAEGYNSVVEEHLRATINPKFSWKDVVGHPPAYHSRDPLREDGEADKSDP